MSLPQLDLTSAPDRRAERRHQSVPVTLFGRYMLESQREFPCQTLAMSPGDMTLLAPVKARTGEKVVVYLDEIGRLAGVAARRMEIGFVVIMNLPPFKREKLADQITWFANRHHFNPSDRRHERVEPLMRLTLMRLADGRESVVKIIDLSLSGAGVETELRPHIGARVRLGGTPGVIARHRKDGVGVEFERPFRPGELDESTRL
jgi:PilZ domain